jgi:hypothetical protein
MKPVPKLKIRNRTLTGLIAPRGSLIAVSWEDKPVILHHSASRQPRGNSKREIIKDEKALVKEFQRHHLAQGWVDIGYHHLVMPSGRVYAGRRPQTRGAHAGHNWANTCPGICVVGNYEKDEPTQASLAALDQLEAFLQRKYGVADVEHPHSRYFPTACCGRKLKRARKL